MSIHEQPRIVGQCVEVGDDAEGQPRLIIHTTRVELLSFGRSLVYAKVEVSLPANSQEEEA